MSTKIYSNDIKYLLKINFLYLSFGCLTYPYMESLLSSRVNFESWYSILYFIALTYLAIWFDIAYVSVKRQGTKITGIIVLLLIISTQNVFKEYSSFFTEQFSIIRGAFFAADVIIFVIAIFGFYAIFTEIYYIKLALVCAMALSTVFQLATSIAITQFLHGKTMSLLQTQMNTTIGFYGGDMNYMFTRDWDRVQEDFSCCGVNSASDWLEYLNTGETGQVPVSCCSRYYGTVGKFNCTFLEAHFTGCAKALGGWAESQLAAMGMVGFVSTMLQLLLTVFAFLRVKDRHVSQAKNDTEVTPEEVKKQVIYYVKKY